jgi:alpha-L-rhamnosidase
MYEVLGGINIDPAFPGYKHVLIQPQPGGGFTHVSASHLTPYGRIGSDWKLSGDKLQLVVVIPPNTTATIMYVELSNETNTRGHTKGVAQDNKGNLFKVSVYN